MVLDEIFAEADKDCGIRFNLCALERHFRREGIHLTGFGSIQQGPYNFLRLLNGDPILGINRFSDTRKRSLASEKYRTTDCFSFDPF